MYQKNKKKNKSTFPLNKNKTFVINHKTSDILEKTIFKLNRKVKTNLFLYRKSNSIYLCTYLSYKGELCLWNSNSWKRKESILLIFETGRMYVICGFWNIMIYNPIESLFTKRLSDSIRKTSHLCGFVS